MATKTQIGKLRDLFDRGTKTKLSEAKTGDTFIMDAFGEPELFMSLASWDYDKNKNMYLNWGHVIGLSSGKQSYNMMPSDADEDIVLVDLRITADLAETRTKLVESLDESQKGALRAYYGAKIY